MMAPHVVLLLALAILIAPQRASRLRPATRRVRWNWKLAAPPLGGLLLAAVVLLPLSVVLAVAVAVATWGVRWRVRRRLILQSQELGALESGLDMVVGELRIGAHPVHAFEVAAIEIGGTGGEVFAAVAARARLGVNPDPARLGAGPVAAQWERVSRSWVLAHHHGLAVADLLDACRADLRERQRFTARVNAGLAGPRATAAVLTGLPVAGIGLGQMIGARPLTVLCSGGVGGALLVVGVVLACVGLVWSDRIIGKALR